MTPLLNESLKKIKTNHQKDLANKIDFKISEFSHKFEEYPPCIRNILTREHADFGATRALTFLATFLGYIEPNAEKAYQIWSDLANK